MPVHIVTMLMPWEEEGESERRRGREVEVVVGMEVEVEVRVILPLVGVTDLIHVMQLYDHVVVSRRNFRADQRSIINLPAPHTTDLFPHRIPHLPRSVGDLKQPTHRYFALKRLKSQTLLLAMSHPNAAASESTATQGLPPVDQMTSKD